MYHSTLHTVPSFFPLCYYTTGAVIVIILLVSVLVMLTIDIVLLIVLINLIMLIVIMITTSAAFISKISTDQLATRECISFFSKRAVRVKGSSTKHPCAGRAADSHCCNFSHVRQCTGL